MIQRRLAIFLFLLILPTLIFSQNKTFNADSVYAHIKHLSVTIGARPMGSQNERIALEWTAEKFVSYGADSVYIMNFTKTEAINTNSGVAVAIFRGETDSTIVIGGHIDSAGREIPGANDNASGTGTVIELARIWGQRERHYTLLFAVFGGEEQGCCGSEYFVDHYSDLKNVVLMFALDMAGGDDKIELLFETTSTQAPKWLVQDAFAIDEASGIKRLQYPTHFSALNNLSEQGAGSDHNSFLEKGIPALCFSVGQNNSPIHTPQDIIAYIDRAMVDQYIRFVDNLICKYQAQGIPDTDQNNYLLWQPWGQSIFIPQWLIIGTNIFACGLGITAFIHSRRHRVRIERDNRVRFSRLKLFILVLIIAIFSQLGEAIIQFIKVLRYPWLVHITEYLWFAAIWAIAGLWLALQFTRKWRFSSDSHIYIRLALILLAIFFVPFMFVSMRLALYWGIALILISLSILIRTPWLRILLSVLAPLPILRLMFFELFTFFARLFALGGMNIDNFGKAFIYSALLTMIIVLCYLPFINAFTSLIVKSTSLKNLFIYLRKPVVGVVILLMISGYGSYLFALPSTSDMWRPVIQAKAEYDISKKESNCELISNEYFKQVQVATDSLHECYNGRTHKVELSQPFSADWIDVSGSESFRHGEKDTVNIDWTLTSSQPWYRVSLRVAVDSLGISDVSSELAFTRNEDHLTFSWSADPPETLQVTAKFTIVPGANIIRTVRGTYADMPFRITIEADAADIVYRTMVEYSDTLRIDKIE